MAAALELVNRVMAALFWVLLWPFGGLHPLWALLFVSVGTGLLMIWVFKKVSNQEGIRAVKNRIQGNLLAVRLYRHDAGIVLRLQGRILCDTGSYLRYSFTPVLILLPPLVLILAQLNAYFESRPLAPGESAVVKASFNGASPLEVFLSLEASSGIQIETPPVRIAFPAEAAWRVRALEPGLHRLVLRAGDESVEKSLTVSDRWGRVSPLRTSAWLDLLLYPGEPCLDGSGLVRSLQTTYPALSLSIGGWEFHWLILYFIFSLVFAFALKGLFDVQF